MADMTPEERRIKEAEIALRRRLLEILQVQSSTYGTFADKMKTLLNVTEVQTHDYEENLKKQRKTFRAEDEFSKARLESAKRANDILEKLEQTKAAGLRQQTDLGLKITKLNQNVLDSQKKQAELQKDLEETWSAQKQSELKEQLNQNKRKEAANREEIRRHTEHIEQITQQQAKLDKAIELASNGRAMAEKQYINESFGGGAARNLKDSMVDKFVDVIGSVFSANNLRKSVDQVWEATKAAISTGAGMAMKDVFTTSLLGLSPKDYIDMQAQFRTTILAVGGVNENFKALEEGQRIFKSSIGDLAETTRFTQSQLAMLGSAGIRPSIDQIQQLNSSYKVLQTLTGQTMPEIGQMMTDMIKEESTQTRLKSARTQQERQQIIQGMALRAQEQAAMGISIEQIKETTAALNKMAGATPIERIKQAARFRAFAGAMGVAGGDEASALIVKGQRRTEAENEQLRKILEETSNTLSQTATGSLGGEIFASTLADKLGFDQLLGPSSPFNTVLAEATKPLPGAADSLTKASEELSAAAKLIQQGFSAVNNNPIVLAILGALGAAGAIAGKGALSSAVRGAGGRIGGGGRAAGRGIGGLAAAVGGGSKMLGAARAVGPLGSLAAGGYMAYDEYSRTGNMGTAAGKGIGTAAGGAAGGWAGALAGAKLGGMLGTFVAPGVGTVIGAGLGSAAGALIGGWGGSKIGESIGGAVAGDDNASTQTARNISTQVDQMNESNSYMKTLLEQSQKTNELLVAQNSQLKGLLDATEEQLNYLKQDSVDSKSARMARAERKYGYQSWVTPGIRG